MADKPGITTLEQLAEVRGCRPKTGRIYSIMYSERFENRATVRAGELVKAGAIGRVVQTIGLGPHRMTPASRPPWFFDKPQLRRHPLRHRVAPGRSVPLLHRLDARRRRLGAGGQRPLSAVSELRGLRRHDAARRFAAPGTSASTGSRRMVCRRGATAGSPSSAPTGSSRCARTSTSPGAPARPPVSRGSEGDALHRLLEGGAAVRRAAGERRAQPHRDRDAAGALLPGHRARAEGAATGATLTFNV